MPDKWEEWLALWGGGMNAVSKQKLSYSASEAAAGLCDAVPRNRNPKIGIWNQTPEIKRQKPQRRCGPLKGDPFLYLKSPKCTYLAFSMEIGAVDTSFW
jgi:hypothetical protein